MLARFRDITVITAKVIELNSSPSAEGPWLWGDDTEILWGDDTNILVNEES